MLARKPGKLPHETVRAEYVLEYGTDALELHADAVAHGARVLVHDDLLATGGTARALCRARRAARRRGRRLRASSSSSRSSTGRERLAGYDVRALCATTPSRCATATPQPHGGRAARARLATSWATRTTCRAGGRASSAWRPSTGEHFTEVLRTEDGPLGARRLPRRRVARARAARAGSRSSRARRSSGSSRPRDRGRCSSPTATGTRVTLVVRQRLRGSARLGGFMVRRATAARARRGARRRWRRCMGREMRWWGWGEDAHAGSLPDARAGAGCEGELGRARRARGRRSRSTTCGWTTPRAARRRVPRALRRRSRARRPRGARRCTPRGKSYPDLVRQRAGDCEGAPDAVVRRATTTRCARCSRPARARASRSCPFGGGTSVVGGLEPLRGGLRARSSRSTSARWTRCETLDERSQVARRAAAGCARPSSRRALGERGFTLGHFPQSYEYATVGGCVATRSAGPGLDRATGASTSSWSGVRLAAPAGDLDLRAQPASAAGPDAARGSSSAPRARSA